MHLHKEGNTVHVGLTDRGREVSDLFRLEPLYQQLAKRSDLVVHAAGAMSATALKDFVYRVFPELTDMNGAKRSKRKEKLLMKFRLDSLSIRLKRETEVIPFAELSYFYGQMGSGKTSIARLVDYCLGGDSLRALGGLSKVNSLRPYYPSI